MLKAVVKAFSIPDLRRRIVFTLIVLAIFRVIAHVPIIGISAGHQRQVGNLYKRQ